ncbi:hypothetical protein B0H12DRAFT_1240212 [Mycena haematopus]|nr:hypothetical protein B0H12DRAFT_1240212 [Mycena haematopus]
MESLPSLSAPAALAQANLARDAAQAPLPTALNTPYQDAAHTAADLADAAADAARLAADASASPLIAAVFLRHQAPIPPRLAFSSLLSAMHEPSFSNVADICDRSHYPDNTLLGLRCIWRCHHHLPEEVRGGRVHDVYERIGRCATFGELAALLEDDWAVSDDVFIMAATYWRRAQSTAALPRAGTSPTIRSPHSPTDRLCSVQRSVRRFSHFINILTECSLHPPVAGPSHPPASPPPVAGPSGPPPSPPPVAGPSGPPPSPPPATGPSGPPPRLPAPRSSPLPGHYDAGAPIGHTPPEIERHIPSSILATQSWSVAGTSDDSSVMSDDSKDLDYQYSSASDETAGD